VKFEPLGPVITAYRTYKILEKVKKNSRLSKEKTLLPCTAICVNNKSRRKVKSRFASSFNFPTFDLFFYLHGGSGEKTFLTLYRIQIWGCASKKEPA
jgi:hypothetical protein